jgi:tetratricopeptide (TPR) repeat protein
LPVRRRWLRWVLLSGVLLAVGLAALVAWMAYHERSARQALAAGHFDAAQEHIDQVLRVRPGWSSAQLLAARIACLRGAFTDAEQHLSLAQAGGMSESLQLEWLLLRCQRGEVDALSTGLLSWANKDHEAAPVILEALAAVYMRQTRYLEALHCLDRWVELAPDSVLARDWRGWVGNQLDHRGQAIGDYEWVLAQEPARWPVRLRLAEILVESWRHGEAVPHLELLRRTQAANPSVLVALARCRVVASKPDEARALLDEVLASQPDHFAALLNRGKVELETQHPVEAERWLRRTLAQKPHDPEARYALWRSLQLQENRQQEAQEELARWQQERKIQDRLVRLMRTELAGNPRDPKLAAETGELLLHVGEDNRGLFWLDRALALDPHNIPSLRALIAHYERSANTAKADEYRKRLAAATAPPTPSR